MSENLGELQAKVKRLRDENDKLRASYQRCMRIASIDDLTGRHRRNISAFECET